MGTHVRPDRLDIEVSDSGPGLDPDVLPHVFDRFYGRPRHPACGPPPLMAG